MEKFNTKRRFNVLLNGHEVAKTYDTRDEAIAWINKNEGMFTILEIFETIKNQEVKDNSK